MRLTVDHGGGAHKGHEACRMIRRATGHLVALFIPWLHNARLRQNPGLRGIQQLVCRHTFVDHAHHLGFLGIVQLAFQQQRRGRHRAHLARQTRGAARTREDADHDLRQADLGLWIVGCKDAVTAKRDFQANAKRRAGQGGRNRLATLISLLIHACALNLAHDAVRVHQPVKKPLGRIIARQFFHLGDDIEVHTARKRAGLARRDDDTFDRIIGQRIIDQAFQYGPALHGHDVHRLAHGVPGDHCDAIGAFFHREISHCISPMRLRCRLLLRRGSVSTSRPERLSVSGPVSSGPANLFLA